MATNKITIRGARVHNLKNINLEIPRDSLVVITGLSGSGKSSLAFDTIYAEAQRRYVESLSAYARQFLGLMDKPDVDQIDGLSPAISIDQRSVSHNPRSTVGTVTEIYDYLRLLFARVGEPHCVKCGRLISNQTTDQILQKIFKQPAGSKVRILAPVVKDRKGEYRALLQELLKNGYGQVRLDGNFYTLEEAMNVVLDKQKKHQIEVVIDSATIKVENKQRLTESLETALEYGNGVVMIISEAGDEALYSQKLYCPYCELSFPDIEPRNFSFNSPHGACPDCTGIGSKLEVSPELVIPNKNLTIAQGAIKPWSRLAANQGWYFKILQRVAKAHKFSLDAPVKDLTNKQLEIVLRGTGEERYHLNFESDTFAGDYKTSFEGVIPNLERRYKETESDYIRSEIEHYMISYPCPSCGGKRLRPEALAIKVANQNIAEVSAFSITEAIGFFESLSKGKTALTDRQAKIAAQILKEIKLRLKFLENVGLSYLALDRAAMTLSGGEAQRIRLATQIGSSLVGVIYILDEPSIGLHQRDNSKLIATLKALRDLGNSVIVVEHDEETILEADWVADIGPGAGEHGGQVVAFGTPEQIKKNSKSLTGQYLVGKLSIAAPKKYRKGNGKFLEIIGAQEFNLKKIDVKIPLGTLTAITGVSGSGKSTLMVEILGKVLSQHFYRTKDLPGKHKEIRGLEHLDKVIDIDQSPIGRTPRSNPATYTGIFTYIRDLFTQLPESKMRGYSAGRFSFNVKGGRCEACQGDGLVKIEMNFLSDVYVECEECHGQRYNPATLEIHYKGKNIADVLNMTVDEAAGFFIKVPALAEKLKTLQEVGLGYIHLGQSATTLSGGEAQRVKLATELSRRATGKTLYILDEPTTGLHFADIQRLLAVLQRLVDKGNSVLVIEHHLDVIKCADWVIDLGPEGGNAGGQLVAMGTPADVAKVKASYTGQYLKKMLKV